jgi:quercetin dioxygenase-like cupin family protein
MNDKDPRYIERTEHYFVHADDVEAEPILSVEDATVNLTAKVPPMVKVTIVTDGFLCTEVKRVKGHKGVVHKHMDHESINYLVSGKMRLGIGEQEFTATPGSYWLHPVGVDHFADILEDSVVVEIKIPPTRTWNLG